LRVEPLSHGDVFDASNEFRMVRLHGDDRDALAACGNNGIIGVLIGSETTLSQYEVACV
jgi:hypothetical protein